MVVIGPTLAKYKGYEKGGTGRSEAYQPTRLLPVNPTHAMPGLVPNYGVLFFVSESKNDPPRRQRGKTLEKWS